MINTEVNSIDEIINIIKTSKKRYSTFTDDLNQNTIIKKEVIANLQKFKEFCESKLNLSLKNINSDFTVINSDTYSGNLKINYITCCYSLLTSDSQEIKLKLIIFNRLYKEVSPLEITYQLWVGFDCEIAAADSNTFESKFKKWLEE